MNDLAYLLVTFAIEVRADEIYPLYESILVNLPVRISVRSIIAEEEGHLAEMEEALKEWPLELRDLHKDACAIENRLFGEWLSAIEHEMEARPIPQA